MFGQKVEIILTSHWFTKCVPLDTIDMFKKKCYRQLMGRRDENTNWGLVEGRRSGGLIIFLPGPLWSGLPAGCVFLAGDKGLSCAGSGCTERFPRRRWSSGCLGNPFVWAPCPATAGGRWGAAQSSRGCWSLFVAWGRQQGQRFSTQWLVFQVLLEGWWE